MSAIHYSRGVGLFDNTPAQCLADDFPSLCAALEADAGRTPEKERAPYVCAPFACAPDDAKHQGSESMARAIGQPHRCADCVRSRRFIGLDADGGMDAEAFAALVALLQPYSGMVWTTHSHKPDAPRCRVLLELDADAGRADLIRATEAARCHIDALMERAGYPPPAWDAQCDRPEQPLFLPPPGAWIRRLEGEPLRLAELAPPEAAPDALQRPILPPLVPCIGDGTAWARAALTRALGAIAAAPPGAWNQTINTEAFGMGGFIASGQLPREATEAALIEATERAGWDKPGKTRGTIRGGIAAGTAKPRTDGLPAMPEAGELQAVPLASLMDAEPEAPAFVIDPLVPRRVATLMGGHGGVGKSMLGLTLCAHVACGRGWGPYPIEHARAVYVSLEDDALVVCYRLRRIIEAYRLPAHLVIENLRVFDGADIEAALMVEAIDGGVTRVLETPVMGQVDAAAAGAGLVMIDNASDAYAGNENNRMQVRAFVRRLARIARANNAGLVLLAHIDKDAAKHGAKGNSYSGSTAWHNSARSRLALLDADGALELRHEKANWGERAPPLQLTRAAYGVLEPMAPGAREGVAAVLANADAAHVLDVMAALIRDGVAIPTADTGQHTTYHALSRAPELGALYRTAEGKARAKAAVTALERGGRIRREVYRTQSRKDRERWALAQIDPQEGA